MTSIGDSLVNNNHAGVTPAFFMLARTCCPVIEHLAALD